MYFFALSHLPFRVCVWCVCSVCCSNLLVTKVGWYGNRNGNHTNLAGCLGLIFLSIQSVMFARVEEDNHEVSSFKSSFLTWISSEIIF
jgi:hypothetical protein